jgi:hypothetical protein
MRFHRYHGTYRHSTLDLGSACQDIFIFSLGFCKRLWPPEYSRSRTSRLSWAGATLIMDALSPALLKILDSNFNGSFAKRGLTSRLHFTPPDVKTRRELMGQWASTLLIYLCSVG